MHPGALATLEATCSTWALQAQSRGHLPAALRGRWAQSRLVGVCALPTAGAAHMAPSQDRPCAHSTSTHGNIWMKQMLFQKMPLNKMAQGETKTQTDSYHTELNGKSELLLETETASQQNPRSTQSCAPRVTGTHEVVTRGGSAWPFTVRVGKLQVVTRDQTPSSGLWPFPGLVTHSGPSPAMLGSCRQSHDHQGSYHNCTGC